MESEYIEQRYVRSGSIERRQYQVALADRARDANCIIVLPTGLGKTAIAAQIMATFLERGRGALFLAPTRVLAHQHHTFLKKTLTISDIGLVTGEDTVSKREKLWSNSVICATPEITKNDLDRKLVPQSQFGLVIFDEAHRAVGDYAYTVIAARFARTDTRMVGMTATLPSETAKAQAIMGTLGARSIEHRNEESDDVRPYVHETSTEWVKVKLPQELCNVQVLLKKALDTRYDALRKYNVDTGPHKSLSALLRLRPLVLGRKRHAARPLFAAISITYALNILEAHGITPFLKFCERTTAKGGAGAIAITEDEDMARAIRLAKSAQSHNIEHSKIPKLLELLGTSSGRAIVFSSYRDSVELIRSSLEDAGISTGILIGKAGESGLRQKAQIEAVECFRDGQYRVLVATRVGEEGLDISDVDLVVFYDNVPSSIRYVQRRGRTGRRSPGRLVVLIAKDTIDETYYWIGKRKMTAAGGMGDKMNRTLQKHPAQTDLDGYTDAD